MKLMITAYLPNKLAGKFFQAIREFDVANQGCRFEILAESNISLEDAIEMLKVNPPLAIEVLDRRDKP
jgi:hypothetical protein